MATIQITSTSAPFDRPEIARSAAGVISTADAMGLLDDLEIRRLDLNSFREVVGKIAEAGIGTEIQAALSSTRADIDRKQIADLLNWLVTVMEDSPVPEHEWSSLEDLFGTERLAQLLGVSPASVRRYRAGARETPDELAFRLHFLAKLVGDLAGAYNQFGIRRWFDRPRTALDGMAPAEVLQGAWEVDSTRVRRLRELARSLTGSPAT
ncbi:MAG TPA: hypothetical protein VE685_08790 [Thermoanaerobaculia bacterium]|nr:hypothetical protein [Thermoanaerobaculia bacterium]